MSCEIKWTLNKVPRTGDKNLPIMSVVEVKKARAFHESIPQHQVTPPADLKSMAEYLSLAKACIRDENYRFGLDAFKVLSGSYTIAKYITKETKRDTSQISYSVLAPKEFCDEFGQATFFFVADGNYGRGVAWATSCLGQKCVIRMSVGSAEDRHRHTEDEGVECTIEKVSYDDCARMVIEEAKRTEHGVVIQDTVWEGYEEIPSWIMQGYFTMVDETVEQFEERPTHAFVQVSVGSLARSVVGYFANKYKRNPPVMVVAETEPAACLHRGAEAADGEIRIVGGEIPTTMASLYCGEPNIASQSILKNHITASLTVNDDVARRGIHMLVAPFRRDPRVVSGKSGVAASGVPAAIMKDESYHKLRSELELNQDFEVLMFSTEGDTDPDRYRTAVWGSKLKQTNAGGKIC